MIKKRQAGVQSSTPAASSPFNIVGQYHTNRQAKRHFQPPPPAGGGFSGVFWLVFAAASHQSLAEPNFFQEDSDLLFLP
jgi:hypothetical protein